jgi:hypothetical protein
LRKQLTFFAILFAYFRGQVFASRYCVLSLALAFLVANGIDDIQESTNKNTAHFGGIFIQNAGVKLQID